MYLFIYFSVLLLISAHILPLGVKRAIVALGAVFVVEIEEENVDKSETLP